MHHKLQPNSSHLLHTAIDMEGGPQANCGACFKLWTLPESAEAKPRSKFLYIQEKQTVRQSHSHGQCVVAKTVQDHKYRKDMDLLERVQRPQK